MPIRIHAPRNTSTRYAKSSVYNRPVVSEKVCAYLTDFQTEIRWFQNKEIFLLSIYIQGFIYLDLLLMSRKFSQKKKKKNSLMSGRGNYLRTGECCIVFLLGVSTEYRFLSVGNECVIERVLT